MIAFKFLRPGAIGLYSGFRWPVPRNGHPGEWVLVEPPLVPSIRGIHACRAGELIDWIDDELWRIELAGDLLTYEGLLVASSGRLLERVRAWDEDAATAFAASCVLSVRDHAVRALERFGHSEEAAELAAVEDHRALQRAAVQRLGRGGDTEDALAFLTDVVELSHGGRPDSYARPSGQGRAGDAGRDRRQPRLRRRCGRGRDRGAAGRRSGRVRPQLRGGAGSPARVAARSPRPRHDRP